MNRCTKIEILVLIVIVGFAGSTGFHYSQGAYLGQPYPKSTFLFDPTARGSDFTDVVRDGRDLNPYLGYSSAQYPFLALVGYAFSLLPRISIGSFLTITSLAFLILTAAFLKTASWTTTATHAFVLTFLSYPFLFAVDRGNFELLVVVILLAFSYLLMEKKHLASAVVLSFAIALKLFPAILLVLFLPERKYRAMAVSVAGAAALTLGSLLLFQGGLAANVLFLLRGSNLGSNWIFANFVSLSSNTVQRGVSILTLLKILSFETGLFQGIHPSLFLGYYVVAAALMGALLVAYVWARERVLWKQAAILTFAMLLLPHISADYKLLHVFIPLYLFVNSKIQSRLDPVYVGLFGLLLIPKDYIYFAKVVSDASSAHDVSIAVPANIVILIALTLLIVMSGIVRRAPATSTEPLSNPHQEGHPEGASP